MGLYRLLGLLALLPLTWGSPVEPAEDTVTVTATSTTTAVTTAPTTSLPPPPPLSDLTVWRTRTVTRWSRTTTIVQPFNCTRTVLVAGNTPTRPTPSRAPPVVPTPARSVVALFARQGNSSTSAPTRQNPTMIPPPSRVTNLPRRTRTSTTTLYVTPTSDLRQTRWECDKTVTYLYTQDRTTTFVLTVTSHPNIATSTTLIDCLPAGRPRFSTSRLPPAPPRTPIPPSASPTVTVTGVSRIDKRQTTAAPVAANNGTITVHVTSTIYSVTTTVNTNTTTVLAYGCKATSTPVVVATTISQVLTASAVVPSTVVRSPVPSSVSITTTISNPVAVTSA